MHCSSQTGVAAGMAGSQLKRIEKTREHVLPVVITMSTTTAPIISLSWGLSKTPVGAHAVASTLRATHSCDTATTALWAHAPFA